MNKLTPLALTVITLISKTVHSQDSTGILPAAAVERMNFFIISRPTKLLDPPTYFNIVRTKIKCFFKRKKFHSVVASSAAQMQKKVEKALAKRKAMIGSLWFDSHGSFRKGYSCFAIGNDEFSFKNIYDPYAINSLQNLSLYCDSVSRIGIGSCYGGATYSRPATEKLPESKMNGDSLMRGMGKIFKRSTVYACESWVMTKPGLFHERFAMAGFPLRKKFKDIVFKPVWQRLGEWNSYNASANEFKAVNCVMLDRNGNINTGFNQYQSSRKVKKQIAQNVKKLKPNLLKV